MRKVYFAFILVLLCGTIMACGSRSDTASSTTNSTNSQTTKNGTATTSTKAASSTSKATTKAESSSTSKATTKATTATTAKAATTEATTAAVSGSYEDIYNEYSAALAEKYAVFEQEMNDECAAGKSMNELAESCAAKVDVLANISAEGVDKMAKLAVVLPATYNDYTEWATKLESEYISDGTNLENIYINGALNNSMNDYQNQINDILSQFY